MPGEDTLCQLQDRFSSPELTDHDVAEAEVEAEHLHMWRMWRARVGSAKMPKFCDI